MATVEQFVEHIRRFGISSKSRFNVSIPFPQTLINEISDSGSGSIINSLDPTNGWLRVATDELELTDGRGPLALARQVSMVCIGARIPGTNIKTFQAPHNGHDHLVATGSNSEDAEFMFVVSRDGAERSVFEKWMGIISDHQTGFVGYYDDYITDNIRIEPKDEYDVAQHHIDLVECFPTTVNAIDLDRTSTNEYQLLTVAFTFKRIRSKGEGGFVEAVVGSKLGQIVDSVAAGDFAAASQHARDAVIHVSQGAYTGEALGAFDMIKEASNNIGINPKATRKVLGAMKSDVNLNPRIGSGDKNSLMGMIDKITG